MDDFDDRDPPVTTNTARIAAARAAAAVRALNHRTLAPPDDRTFGWEDLHDVYAVIGELNVLARGLRQALRQVAAGLERPPAGTGYGTDDDSDAARTVDAANAALRAAETAAQTMERDLAAAHTAVSHLSVARRLNVLDGTGE